MIHCWILVMFDLWGLDRVFLQSTDVGGIPMKLVRTKSLNWSGGLKVKVTPL